MTDLAPDTEQAASVVGACGRLARGAAPSLAAAPRESIDRALSAMAERLDSARVELLAANGEDVAAAERDGMTAALIDRLRLGEQRLADMAEQLTLLARAPEPDRDRVLERRPDGLVLIERRRPVGVIGATFEARPNVTIDVASQLVKSRNAGVLRTGAAALRSALALAEHVICPALTAAGLDPGAIQVVADPGHDSATALVSNPDLVPLVILRGSGETTRRLASEAARHGVRTMAHADGGGVLYVDRAADPDTARELVGAGLDRLGVCNRLNLLLLARGLTFADELVRTLGQHEVTASLPPHDHLLGHEWALEAGRENVVTVSYVDGPAEAAEVANQETSGLAATVVTEDNAAARQFIDAYAGTGVFWNATTRLLDGFKLRRVPETGINVDRVPGPRGPVTFEDLYLRQYVIVPAARTERERR